MIFSVVASVTLSVLPCSKQCGHLVVRKNPLGRKPVCKDCQREGQRHGSANYRADNAARLRAYRKDWLAQSENAERTKLLNIERIRAEKAAGRNYDKARRRDRIGTSKTPEADRDYHRKRKYGITRADYVHMLSEQNGVCAICSSPPENKELRVDHDHGTGKVRGLLCDDCNVGIGRLKDSASNLRRAVSYLEQHEENK